MFKIKDTHTLYLVLNNLRTIFIEGDYVCDSDIPNLRIIKRLFINI